MNTVYCLIVCICSLVSWPVACKQPSVSVWMSTNVCH